MAGADGRLLPSAPGPALTKPLTIFQLSEKKMSSSPVCLARGELSGLVDVTGECLPSWLVSQMERARPGQVEAPARLQQPPIQQGAWAPRGSATPGATQGTFCTNSRSEGRQQFMDFKVGEGYTRITPHAHARAQTQAHAFILTKERGFWRAAPVCTSASWEGRQGPC